MFDLLREKELTAIKCSFKTELIAFSIGMWCLQAERSSTHFTQGKKRKEKKTAVNLVLLTDKQETRSPYLTL